MKIYIFFNRFFFILNYQCLNNHLVLVIKYRRKVINDEISNRLKEIFEYDISKFLNAYKSASSRLIKKEFESIRNQLWKEYFWSRSYCLITNGGAPIGIVRKYIENQGMK